MPWKVFHEGGKFCVHKMNSDGSKGETIPGGCHPEKDKATAHARAMYASENKAITDETLNLLKEISEDNEGDKIERASIVLEDWKEKVEYDSEVEEVLETKEQDEKCMPEYVPMGVFSFDELDQQRKADDQIKEVNQIMADYQSLLGNIINTPAMLLEKDKFEALDELYQGFRERIDESMQEEDGSEEKASRREDVSAADRKRAVSEYGDVKYADEANKKYPIDTEAHIRAAWNYIGQKKNQAKYSSSEVASIKRKIIAAWKSKIGSEGPPSAKEKDILDRFIEVGNTIKSWFQKPEEPSLSIWKEGNTYWWLARYSNKFRDNDNPREIISSDSHKRFVQLVKEGKAPLPELWGWHIKDWKVGQAHSVAYDDLGFAVAIGTFDVGHEDVAVALKNSKEPVLLSHGMPLSSIKRDATDPTIIVEHETREISFLPAWAAANKLTGFAVLNPESKEESMAIPDETKKEWISKLGINPETLKSLEDANAEDANKAATEGLESKEVTEEAQPASQETTETEEKPADEEAEKPESAPLTVDQLRDAVQEAVKSIVAPVMARMDTLEASMKEIKEASEKRDKALEGTPTASLSAIIGQFAQSAIGAPETRVDGRTKLAESKPKEAATQVVGRTGIGFIDEMLAGNSQQEVN